MELEARDELDVEEAEDELEESFALFEPQALKAKMPATARDTHAVAFLVVINRILSPDKYQLVF